MSEQEKPGGEQAEGQELSHEQLEQVSGGILIGMLLPAVQKGQKVLPAVQKAMGDGSVRPGESLSLNFTKK